MNWDWASSLDQIWRSATFPMWVTLAAAGFFALVLLVTLIRAEKSVANGALTVITLLAVAVAVAATIRGFGWPGAQPSSPGETPPPAIAASPALSCIDDLAGETVLTACEKTLFGSAESAAAAISYAASQITRLTSLGDVATVNRNLTPEVETLRRSIERDRYGLMAYVLVARDHCTPQACAAFRSLGNSRQIMTNMDDRVYESLVMRYSASWGAPALPAVPSGALAALPPTAGVSVPTGKPTTMIDFPSASSTPPVNIMTPEPGAPGSAAPPPRAAAPAAATPSPAPRPAAASAAPPAAKKQAPPKSARAPTQLAPPPGSTPPSSPPPAPAPAADND
ncbi:MAG TPA: hypothetical protein VJR30_11575 [Bradyrhizobium sp.]|nr:hypothetical protein [Bradyrhizobium sp.]